MYNTVKTLSEKKKTSIKHEQLRVAFKRSSVRDCIISQVVDLGSVLKISKYHFG